MVSLATVGSRDHDDSSTAANCYYSSCGVSSGIGSGQTLPLQGERGAAAIREGTPGSLFVEVSIAADPVLRHHGPFIHVSTDLHFVDANLGGDSK